MELTPEFSRLAKMLIDAEGISQAAAEERLRSLTLEIVVGPGAACVAGQNAVLTAVAAGLRTFVGGVSICFDEDISLATSLPIPAASLGDAAFQLGAKPLKRAATARIAIGVTGKTRSNVRAWWDGWKAGSSASPTDCGDGDNPLAGIVAGAAAVAHGFAIARGVEHPYRSEFDLWPSSSAGPAFSDVFLPQSLWLLGLGNLGQAMVWSLTTLPYAQPEKVLLILQDRDLITPENWGTSILVQPSSYGQYKTAIVEAWARSRGFEARRIDRWLDGAQQRQGDEPAVALCGFDNIDARRAIADCGFEVVIDAGLGRSHSDFDRYRVTVFDRHHDIGSHFAPKAHDPAEPPQDYETLLGLDKCGAAVFAGIAVAAPFVSAIAGAIAVARAVAISSGAPVPRAEVRRLNQPSCKLSLPTTIAARGLLRQRPSLA